jgi:ComEC/Rec2-related protein
VGVRLSHLTRPLALALAIYCGWLIWLKAQGRFDEPARDDASAFAPREPALAAGRVASLPIARKGRQEFLLDVSTVDGASASGRVLVRLAGAEPLDLGDRVSVSGRLGFPPPSLIEGAPSWRGYLDSIGVHSILRGDRLAKREQAGRLLRAVSAFRRRMVDSFRRLLPPDDAAVLDGIVLGDKSALPRGELDAFRDAGAIYLLVTSGLHVNFLLLLVAWAVRRLGGPRWIAVALGLAAGGFYTLAAGFGPPLSRAYAMTLAASAGWLLDRDGGAFQGLVLAAWALLLAEPAMLFQAGFQMSCAATLAILVVMSHWKLPRGWPRPFRWACEAVLVSAAAQLSMAPLSAAYFHRISAVGYLCNPVLVPAAMALLAGGFALFAVSFAPPFAAAPPAAALRLGIELFRGAIGYFGRLPWAAVWVPAPSPLVHAASGFLLLAALGGSDSRRAKRLAAAGAACLVPAAVAAARPASLEIAAAPSAQTALARRPDGRLELVNAGLRGEDLGHSVLAAGRASVDEVRLTGLSRRRWKGLERLSEMVRVARVVRPPGREPEALAELRARLQARGVEWSVDAAGRDEGRWKTEWKGLSCEIGSRGIRFDGDYEQFDIIGSFERRPRRAVTLRFDGAVARMSRPS